ncbi:MAG: PASTA domain-containing protein [Candidatus Hydrogenedentota bacterium]
MWLNSTLSRSTQFLVAIVTLSLLLIGCPQQPEPEEVQVPLLVNQDRASAENAIENAGLVVGTVEEWPSGKVAAGDILEQDPSFGTMVERGTAVDIVVAIEPDARIASIDRLQQIGTEDYPLDGFYVLADDIDATATANWDNGLGFDPIRMFEGVLDGQGYVITGLTIERTAGNEVGLFSVLGEDGVIKNVGLEDCAVTGQRSVGGLAGLNLGSIEGSFANGAVAGVQFIGGLVGSNDGLIEESSARAVVEGGSGAGGLVGDQVEGTISESYALGAVTGELQVGGLVGWNTQGSISNTYATGAVTGESQVGGLLGRNEGGAVSKSYATGAVEGESQIGGLVGTDVGGEVEVSFWNTRTTDQNYSAGGQERTTGEMVRRATYTEAEPAWDFTNVWDIEQGESYPYLRNAEGGGVLVPDVIGLAQDEAEEAIEAAGLRVGEITQEFDEDIAEGEVIEQDPDPDDEVMLPADVDIVVSLGPDPDAE